MSAPGGSPAKPGPDAFGYNLVEIGPGGQMPEHNEAESGQEEVYAMLEGEGDDASLDGEEHPAPAGTFVSLEPRGQAHDPQPLRGAGDGDADRGRPERRLRADDLG